MTDQNEDRSDWVWHKWVGNIQDDPRPESHVPCMTAEDFLPGSTAFPVHITTLDEDVTCEACKKLLPYI